MYFAFTQVLSGRRASGAATGVPVGRSATLRQCCAASTAATCPTATTGIIV